jgi:nitronate monooxygenase
MYASWRKPMSPWPDTELTDRLGIRYPIIQAPMASASTPALAIAVSTAGGLGSLGLAMHTQKALRNDCATVSAAVNAPYNANFFVHSEPVDDPARATDTRSLLAPYYHELGLGQVPDVVTPAPSFNETHLQAVLDLRPPVVSFHFGLPGDDAFKAIKAAGLFTLSSATNVAEARELEARGVDAVIAQGFEAGGHRGTFSEPYEKGHVGTLALVPQVVDAVSIPVIAAGGIGDGRGIAAALALGASAVQLGTAFLTCPESATHPIYRRALNEARDDQTRITHAFSGRPARGLENRYLLEMAGHEARYPDFPILNSLTGPLRKTSAKENNPDFLSLWSGQSAAMSRNLPASELIQLLVTETESVLERLATAR